MILDNYGKLITYQNTDIFELNLKRKSMWTWIEKKHIPWGYNTVSQLLTYFSQQFNKINQQNIDKAVSNEVPISTISTSSLTTLNQPTNSSLNSQSLTRKYLLIAFTKTLSITTSNSIKLQSSSLVNGPLQQRTTILDLDSQRAKEFPQDYETDLESEWMKINLYQQKELANQIKEMISRLNSILNIGQQSIFNTSEVLMSLQSEIIEFLSPL